MIMPRGGKLLSGDDTIRMATGADRQQQIERIVAGLRTGGAIVGDALLRKLRSYSATSGYSKIMRRAADEIESLRQRVAELEKREAR